MEPVLVPKLMRGVPKGLDCVAFWVLNGTLGRLCMLVIP